MKRMLVIIAALSAACGSLWAQDASTDPSEDYVLQKAREKFSATSTAEPSQPQQPAQPEQPAQPAQPERGQTTTIEVQADESARVTIEISKDSPAAGYARDDGRRKYFPFVLSLVPGVSIPFGIYDTSISAAPIGAITGSVFGAQGAGVFNIADGDLRGLQGAGVFNIVGENVRGIQGAGVFNIADDVRGAQGAGVFNIADRVDGVQMAGVFNIADEMHGAQLSGVVNVAGKAEGAMIGVVNIAEELDGVAIGLVNIIGNGIHDIGFDYQFASKMAYATYRSGTPFLYATFYAGQPVAGLLTTTEGVSLGGGLGHRFKILFITADVEIGSETPVDSESLTRLAYALRSGDGRELAVVDPWSVSFGSLRATFGFGKRKGFGPYLGIKADFAPTGSEAVPPAMRYAFGSAEPYRVTLFDTSVDIWPKWFVGVKF